MSPRPMSDREGGFAYFEAMMALVLIAVAMSALAHTLADSGRSMRRISEKQLAMQAAMDVVEDVRALEFGEVLPTYREGGTVGPEFPLPIFQGQSFGRVEFFTDETAADAELPMPLGFPRDLDGDGLAVSGDVTGTARVLVGMVSVTWGPPTCPQTWRVPVVLRP